MLLEECEEDVPVLGGCPMAAVVHEVADATEDRLFHGPSVLLGAKALGPE